MQPGSSDVINNGGNHLKRPSMQVTDLDNTDRVDKSCEMQKTTQGWLKDQGIGQNKGSLRVDFQNTQSTLNQDNGFQGGFADRVKQMTL